MKIILVGATGFIGSEILEQLIANPYISDIFCLLRHTLAPHFRKSPKVHMVLHDNLEEYPIHIIQKLKNGGAEGCIWAAGGQVHKFKTLEEARQVNINYPLQAAEAFSKELATELDPNPAPNTTKFPFRFVFISETRAEQDSNKALWFYADSRKIKGAAEKGLFDIANQSKEVEVSEGNYKRCFDVIALRPGAVIPKGEALSKYFAEATSTSCAVDRVAKLAIRSAMQGAGEKKILENADILGKEWMQINSLNI
ncbi:hypothetical protein MBLNU230_g2113t1 [Neophaeotheca triangularis]